MRIFNYIKKGDGFVILFAVTLAAIILSISLGVANVAFKEAQFATNAKDTNDAFTAADTGAECALFNDKLDGSKFPMGGVGAPASIPCGGNNILITYSPANNVSTYTFVVPNLGSSLNGCAIVHVVKNPNSPTSVLTTVTSSGYNTGSPSCASNNPNRVERQLAVSSFTGDSTNTQTPSAYSAAVLADSPIAYWRLEETSGLNMADASGNGHNATLNSSTGITRGVGGALSDSSTGIKLGTAAGGITPMATFSQMNLQNGPVSYEFWIKPLIQGGDTFGDLLGGDDDNIGYGFYLIDSGSGVKLDAWFDTGLRDPNNNDPLNDQYNNTALLPGQLYHVVASIDAGGHGKWYLNGSPDGTFTYPLPFKGDVTYPGFVLNSMFQNEGGEPLQASLVDEIAVYRKALTQTQVLNHYNKK